MKRKHKCFQVKSSGLVINRDIPILRASPDGLISCKCYGNGTLDIKCPYKTKLQAMTGEEKAREGKYYLEMVDNEVHLKHNSPWYTQIQTHLGITKYLWCDFVIFTKMAPNITVERIYFDKERFDREVERGLDFYEKFVMPKLINRTMIIV